jgi:hypothetical protein
MWIDGLTLRGWFAPQSLQVVVRSGDRGPGDRTGRNGRLGGGMLLEARLPRTETMRSCVGLIAVRDLDADRQDQSGVRFGL